MLARFKSSGQAWVFGAGILLALQNGTLRASEQEQVRVPGNLYDQLFPYSAEFCSVSRIQPKAGKPGGIGGHGVIFIKGVCRDTSASYPRLKVCEEGGVDLSRPESGTFISVDEMFSNVNWVAIDGKDLMINGHLPPHLTLDQAAMDATVREVLERGYFRGIRFHEEYMKAKPAGMSEEEFVVREGAGTDFGLNFGRDVYCARFPVRQDMLPAMVGYLNSRNDDYASGKEEYHWSGVFNNCTHTTHNALAAAGVFRPYGVDEFPLLQLFNLAIPANEFIDIEELGNDTPLDDVVALYRDSYRRKSLLEHDWLPVQAGVVTENLRIHSNNQLYQTEKATFLVLDLPVLELRRRKFRQIMSEPRYSDLRENLKAFLGKLRQALQERDTLDFILAQHQELQTDRDFPRFYAKHEAYLKARILEVEAKLSQIGN